MIKHKKEQNDKECALAFSKENDNRKANEWNYSIQKLYDNPLQLKAENSLANNASLSFLLFYNGTVSLFAGDANPNDMIETINRYLNENGNGCDKMAVDFMKMPHHASSYNNPLEFIEKFPTKYYLISTEGHNGYKHPGKQTIANIARAHVEDIDREIYILCNYPTWKNPNISFKDKEISWNVKDDLCNIKDKNNKSVQLKFVELKRNGIIITNSVGKEVKISL